MSESKDAFTVRLGDRAVTVPARCPHRGAPLARGVVIGAFLECPWHGATFDLRTGRWLRGPKCPDLAVASGGPGQDEFPSGQRGTENGLCTDTAVQGEDRT